MVRKAKKKHYTYVLRFTKRSQSIHCGNLHIEHKLFNAPHPKCSNQPWSIFSGLNIHPTSSIPPIPANINPRIINPDPDCSQVGQLPLTNITVKEYDKILFEQWNPPISILGETVALLILGQRKRLLLYPMKYPNQRFSLPLQSGNLIVCYGKWAHVV